MRKYDKMTLKVAERIFEKGDKLIELRKKRAAKIRHISYAVSGLCAAVIVCVGVWHFSLSQKMPNDGFIHSDFISVTEPTTNTVTNRTVTTQKVTSVTEAITHTTLTTQKITSMSNTENTVTNVEITTEDYSSVMVNVPETTFVSSVISTTVSLSEEVNTTTLTTTIFEVIVPVTTPIFDLKQSYATVVIKENNIRYHNQNTLIEKNRINNYICTSPVMVQVDEFSFRAEKMELYEIDGISVDESIAVKPNDTNEYFLFYNLNFKKEDNTP